MEASCVYIIIICMVFLFLVILTVMLIHDYLLLKSADRRLKMANDMVLKLADSSDKLATSVVQMKEMMIHLEQVYTARNDTLTKNRDEFRESYKKLLTKYEELESTMLNKYDAFNQEIFNTIKEMARKPTITNHPISK